MNYSAKKLLVTGSNGQLGSELKELSKLYPSWTFIFLTRTELPLHDEAAIEKAIVHHNPNYLINCAAYTAVDKAETEKDEAFQINGMAVGVMAKLCAAHQIRFIHISTDYVFDGTSQIPLIEDDKVHPVNVYGDSKLAGEEAAFRQNLESLVIRTSWVYSFYGKNFVKTMMRLLGERESLNVVGDQWGSPTYAADLAAAILQIIQQDGWHPGIYHFSNDGVISWAQFAQEIARLIDASCEVISIPTEAYPTLARRPLFSVMDKTKISRQFGITLKPWQQSLQVCLQKLTAVPTANHSI